MVSSVRKISLTGQSDVKGRNGYFRAVAAEGMVLTGMVPPHVRLEITSARIGDSAPSVFDLDPADALALGQLFLELGEAATR
jgi:hypothetical protein